MRFARILGPHRLVAVSCLLAAATLGCGAKSTPSSAAKSAPSTSAPSEASPSSRQDSSPTEPAAQPAAAVRPVTLATTTSTLDSGLLDVLLAKFREATGIEVKVVAVGSGQALELGRRGDADALMVHSPEAETKFMADGYGEKRLPLMHNDFVLVGPAEDPARVRGTANAVDALRKIAGASATFVSRGDESGTHAKEQSLWKQADLDPQGSWYLQVGSGMAETLRIATEKSGYTLTDRATFLAQRQHLKLEILVEGDESLLNHYSIIQISRSNFPDLNHAGVERFIAFLGSESAHKIIESFGRHKFGQPLFFLSKSAERAAAETAL
jgi:tungstate transport system substrate-binding protein